MSWQGSPRATGGRGTRLRLWDGWRLICGGEPVPMAPAAQRVVALLALRGRQSRGSVVNTLWPEATELQAHASLRSTIGRLQLQAPWLLRMAGPELDLDPYVEVDVRGLTAAADWLITHRQVAGNLDDLEDAVQRLPQYGELLPGWYDDWVYVERERLHHLRLEALEAGVEHFVAAGRCEEAIDAALAAIYSEPLRESSHRQMISAHLAAGDADEALRHFERFRALLQDELGLPPSKGLRDLVAPLRDHRATVTSADFGGVDRGSAYEAQVTPRFDAASEPKTGSH